MAYTAEQLKQAVSGSASYMETLHKLGRRTSGSAYTTLKRALAKHAVDTSHFPPARSRGGMTAATRSKHTPDTVLVWAGDKTWKQSAKRLKKALIQTGMEHRCSLCGLQHTWQDKPITLEIDHINGNNKDNRRENLRFVCPNCHSQLPTSVNQKRKQYFCACGEAKSRVSSQCKRCAAVARGTKNRKVVHRPDVGALIMEVEQTSYRTVGRKYGVSDVTIRKWINSTKS